MSGSNNTMSSLVFGNVKSVTGALQSAGAVGSDPGLSADCISTPVLPTWLCEYLVVRQLILYMKVRPSGDFLLLEDNSPSKQIAGFGFFASKISIER